MPSAVQNGTVRLQGQCVEVVTQNNSIQKDIPLAHNFFEHQPIENVSVFLLRFVIHDWPDELARKIFRQLRRAAGPQTKMVLLEFIVPYTCASTTGDNQFSDIPGVETPSVPYPLLPSLGPASSHIFFLDMRVSTSIEFKCTVHITNGAGDQMMNNCNSPERTIGQWVELAEGTGWKLEMVKRGPLCSLIYKTV